MEECCWIEAAVKVLTHAEQPMHYVDIKRIILEMGLVPSKWVFETSPNIIVYLSFGIEVDVWWFCRYVMLWLWEYSCQECYTKFNINLPACARNDL